MSGRIAIVGMACRYPDAATPEELWEMVVAQRRAFRRIPPERLCLGDYLPSAEPDPDSTYLTQAALLEGYEFDRVRFRVAGSTYRSSDLTHWLALDVAAAALASAGFPEGENLPRGDTGVLVGNSLTGEFSRAATLRLRWPYVRRVLGAVLRENGTGEEERGCLLRDAESLYKAPFPAPGEETLAGGLSNTIAGRICNHFDLGGGGYTLDGACCSSLLAVAQGCSALEAGDVEVMVAGGVDLSLDPFELVGFARTGALAPTEMRVYDRRSAGFWPGEGCGFVVLMREREARRRGLPIVATIRGWGISSDGAGGLTRPEVCGQRRALQRAYRRAGFGIDTVPYIEGHGTGTPIGDTVELKAISEELREAGAGAAAAAIGSVKANFGHTKAAAGVAGLIKAAVVLEHRVLPPTTASEDPHGELDRPGAPLRTLREGETWPAGRPLRAAVSSAGFGGINVHLVLERAGRRGKRSLDPRTRRLLHSAQDAELILLAARNRKALRREIDELRASAHRLSRAELADLSVHLARRLDARLPARVAVVADTPQRLAGGLRDLSDWLDDDVATRIDARGGVFLGTDARPGRVGLLFTGQGSPSHLDGGAMRRRFGEAADLYRRASLPEIGDPLDAVETSTAQPAIVCASLAALRVLRRAGIEARGACGHSLGELTALAWGGAFSEQGVLRLAAARGRLMSELASAERGAMAALAAAPADVERWLEGSRVVIAGYNGAHSTVISGSEEAVEAAIARARADGCPGTRLRVSHAFHSPLMEPVVGPFSEHVAGIRTRRLTGRVFSTVSGGPVAPGKQLRELLRRQLTSPVRFHEALGGLAGEVDLLLEVGPGRVLSSLAAHSTEVPAVPLDAGGASLDGLLSGIGAAFVIGAAPRAARLLEDRFSRPFEPGRRLRFLANPCEAAPAGTEEQPAFDDAEPAPAAREVPPASQVGADPAGGAGPTQVEDPGTGAGVDPLEVIRHLAAERTELPLEVVGGESRFLDDLHLNSIAVGLLVAEAARRLGVSAPAAPNEYANATLGEVAGALAAAAPGDAHREGGGDWPEGVDTWVRPWQVTLVERSRPRALERRANAGRWRLFTTKETPGAMSLRESLEGAVGGDGVLVVIHPAGEAGEGAAGEEPPWLEPLLAAARQALCLEAPGCFVLLHHGGDGEDAAAVARTLHLEEPRLTTCVVETPPGHPKIDEWVCAEAASAVAYQQAIYDGEGRRREARLTLLAGEPREKDAPAELPLGAEDHLLVTGGGKGIAAECALALGRLSGARLLLAGRSRPGEDPALAAQLARLEAHGIAHNYISTDVTSLAGLRASLERAEGEHGPITGVLHGAGVNEPALLRDLDRDAFRRALAPKVGGLENLLRCLDGGRLRLLVTFGSVIARTGLRGEAHYALANSRQTRITEIFQEAHPDCRCLAVEWSVWSGTGMGERLQTLEGLLAQGITAIRVDEGCAILEDLLTRRRLPVAVVVAGRLGEPPTLPREAAELPLLRFLERPRVFHPGIELVAEAEVSLDSDPYLRDHVFRGEPLLPAVMGLEAMAQAAMAVTGSKEAPRLEGVEIARPVTVGETAPRTIRLAALAREDESAVDVVLRSDETGFQTDHYRARARWDGEATPSAESPLLEAPAAGVPPVPLEPREDLYGDLLFHTGLFQRLRGYRELSARRCVAEVTPCGGARWFHRYLPETLVLGDPGLRDGAIHSIQACVPNASFVPIAVERLIPSTVREPGVCTVRALERRRIGDRFIYDLEVWSEEGRFLEQWRGLHLQLVSGSGRSGAWVEPLLGPYIERAVGDLLGERGVLVAVERNGAGLRSLRSERALARAACSGATVHRRADGKPEIEGADAHVSVAHAGSLTLAVASPGPVACDVEPVVSRSEKDWQGLLGEERRSLASRLSTAAREDAAISATRVWSAMECLTKAGASPTTPLLVDGVEEEGWVVLSAGRFRGATVKVDVRGESVPLVFAVMVEDDGASL